MLDFSFILPNAEILTLCDYVLDRAQRTIELTIVCHQSHSACPQCQTVSHRIHSHYQRHLADLPWGDFGVTLHLSSRKFFCDQPNCPQKVFTERLPQVTTPWSRCTDRLNALLTQLGLIIGGQAGARMSQHCRCHRSRNTLLTRVKRLTIGEDMMPTRVGVDDFAFRKGQTYGTILVDLDGNRPIALLPDREAVTLQAWLEAHPGIEILSRDRSKTYKQAMDQAAPDAIQVADRFHLLHNLEETLETCFNRHIQHLKAVEAEYYGTFPPPAPKPPAKTNPEQRKQASRAKRYHNYTQVHKLRQAGWTIQAIVQEVGIGKRTVYTYLSQPEFREYPTHPRKGYRPLVAPYSDYLMQRWQAGIHQYKQLFREIQQQGYQGGYGSVIRYLKPLREPQAAAPSASPIAQMRARLHQKPLTVKRAAWLCMKLPENRRQTEQALFDRMGQQPDLANVISLGQAFLKLVRQRLPEQLNAWLAQANDSGIKAFKRFARGIQADYEAVKAALSLDVSNGPVEGLNNRLKMLKRSMYGRASLDLLAKRFILSH